MIAFVAGFVAALVVLALIFAVLMYLIWRENRVEDLVGPVGKERLP